MKILYPLALGLAFIGSSASATIIDINLKTGKNPYTGMIIVGIRDTLDHHFQPTDLHS